MGTRVTTESSITPTFHAAARALDFALRRLAEDLAYGADPSRFVGSGNEYAQSRPFVEGDDVRHIDWRVTARTGRTHVKEFEAMRRAPLVMLVDTSASMDAASVAPTKREVAAWLAGALGLVARQRMSPVGVLCCGERASRFMPSLSGGQAARWLEEISRPAPGERTALTRRIDEAAAMFPRMCAMVVLSDMHDPGAADAVQRLALRHDCVVLQIQDPAEAGGLRAGFLRAAEAETGERFVAASRDRFLESDRLSVGPALSRGGIDHLLLRTDGAFVEPLRHFLRGRGGLWRRER